MLNIYTELKNAGIRLINNGHIHKEDIIIAEPILLKYIKAAPQYAKDTEFNFDDPVENFQMFQKLQKKKGIVLKQWDRDSYQLVKYPSYVALIDSKHISYLVEFKKNTIMGKKCVTQILLWREAPNRFVSRLKLEGLKLTEYVFFKRVDYLIGLFY